MVYERARREAQSLRNNLFRDDRSIDALRRLADDLNAVTHFVDLEPGMSGFIIKHADKPVAHIYINGNDSLSRQRFTLAHEIGHLVDRSRVANDKDYSFTDYRDMGSGYNLHEFFADEFAGELLMPARPFIKAYRDGGADAAAREFGVSPAAAEKRLNRLRMNPPTAG